MKKQNLILSAALAAVFSASTAFAEAEVTGKIVHESAKFTTTGTTIGAAAAHGKDVFKQETSARIYIDGEIDEVNEGSTYHVELNLMRDSKGIGKYDSNESYTQRDALREVYVDTTVDDWSIRAGKQQVVWGTADGMKLLDAINPTDYSEMAQNQMEDSRIPVFMINAEKDLKAGGSFQFILSDAKKNKIAGLNASGDQGNPFIMKGVDTITGKENGWVAIAKDFGKVAAAFGGMATHTSLVAATTVQEFIDSAGMNAFGGVGSGVGYTDMAAVVTGVQATTNLLGPEAGNLNNGAFGEVRDTAFGTFEDFKNMTSEYRVNDNADGEANLGVRYKNSTTNGLNYSLNYLYQYDANPIVQASWEEASTGRKLTQEIVNGEGYLKYSDTGADFDPGLGNSDGAGGCGTLATGRDINGNIVDPAVAGAYATCATNPSSLVFEESLNRIHNLGGSFDTVIETASLGSVVIRGEGLYQKDVMTPVLYRNTTAANTSVTRVGALADGLTMQKGDMLKYVLGADITVMTNMMVSAQLIQLRNLDYVDNASGYTMDQATLHLSNDLQKAEKNKEFYSLFFSKPFGASGEHRWNNITMYEENGGKWNRLDAEFSIDDDTQATVEYNKYWGNANTQFGQLEKSSNIQVGVKYSF